MKQILRLLFFILISAKTFSQNATEVNKIIYLDSMWSPTTAENYKYTRLIEEYYSDKKSYVYKDFYKSGKLKFIAITLNKDVIINDGQAISYYENGNKKYTVNYVKEKKSGKEFSWYENGDIKSEITYSENKKGSQEGKINNFWNTKKERIVADGNGYYSDKSENNEQSGQIKNGVPDGTWTGKDFKKKSSFIEMYKNGELISGITTDSLNVKHSYSKKHLRPSPKNGINSFNSYIGKSMRIPLEARKVSGKIYMSFIVDEEGNLVEPKVLKGVGYGIDENAIQLIKEAQKWNPGKIRGIPLRALYKLPITIIGK
ncbi:antitoxin component YwqK of YwqJK toxin-antitoxin module [Flavobacterium cutihirudinis]|uniref:Antitoxin component YwqK of YwqJK toxin-antitoxin module n=1 Tax=Flavobacterium cutihirudinis TaxID=1265740 RepID=A0A3D9FX59_9FLAO|nr:energy transducer TonB [Flavobacterium cutihirudinis]RED25330.1 antitoxin component YwqK of YwqJK toxin-antitoxin module [Flavobacterium cutihirudinis]